MTVAQFAERLRGGAPLDGRCAVTFDDGGADNAAHTHCDLSRADVNEAIEEMSSSKTALEELVDREVVSFAYPSCGYSEDCPAAAELAGYTSAVTCGPRGGRSPYELRRDMIGTHDRGLRFALKSRGAAHAARRPRRWLTEVRRP